MGLNCNALKAETVNIRLEDNNYGEVIASLEKSWKSVYPTSPFKHWFMDEEFEKLYLGEIRMQKLSDYFAVFTILIACLGLFGLASSLQSKRQKRSASEKYLERLSDRSWYS